MKKINLYISFAFFMILGLVSCQQELANDIEETNFVYVYQEDNEQRGLGVTVGGSLTLNDLSQGLANRTWEINNLDSAVFVGDTLSTTNAGEKIQIKFKKVGTVYFNYKANFLNGTDTLIRRSVVVKDTMNARFKFAEIDFEAPGQTYPGLDQEVNETTAGITIEQGTKLTFESLSEAEPDQYDWNCTGCTFESGKAANRTIMSFKTVGKYGLMHRVKRITPWSDWDTLFTKVDYITVVPATRQQKVVSAADTKEDDIEVSFLLDVNNAGNAAMYKVEIEETAGAGDYREVTVTNAKLKSGDATKVVLEIEQTVSNSQAIRVSVDNSSGIITSPDGSPMESAENVTVDWYRFNYAAAINDESQITHPWSDGDSSNRLSIIEDADAFKGKKVLKFAKPGGEAANYGASKITFQIDAAEFGDAGEAKFIFAHAIKFLADNNANLSIRFNGENGKKIESGFWLPVYKELNVWHVRESAPFTLKSGDYSGIDLAINFIAYGPPTRNHDMLMDDFVVFKLEETKW